MNRIKLAIVEDHSIFREMLSKSLDSEEKFEVLIRASNGEEFFEALKKGQLPSIVVLDLDMPVMDGRDVIYFLKKEKSDIKILILSMHYNIHNVKKYKELGVHGYLGKGMDYDELIRALFEIDQGNLYFPLSNTKDYLDEWNY